jgi:hypothetical protein
MGMFGHHKELFICTSCETIDDFQWRTSGSFFVEVILWILTIYLSILIHWFFLFLGGGYSLWRITSRKVVCRACGSDTKVPLSSPVGQKLTSLDPGSDSK